MSFAEIQAELDHLSPEETRLLALTSWETFVTQEAGAEMINECHETDPSLRGSLDEALAHADANPEQGHSGNQNQLVPFWDWQAQP